MAQTLQAIWILLCSAIVFSNPVITRGCNVIRLLREYRRGGGANTDPLAHILKRAIMGVYTWM